MALTSRTSANALTPKLWAKALAAAAPQETYFSRFAGTDANSAFQVRSELGKHAGDQLTIGLRMKLGNDGVTDGQAMQGAEEPLVFYSDALLINELANAVSRAGIIDEQRGLDGWRQEALDGLSTWFGERLDEMLFNQLAGNTYTGVSSLRLGFNTVVGPTSNADLTLSRWICSGIAGTGSLANEATVEGTSTSILKLTDIDKAIERARMAVPRIRPIRVDGQDKYLLFIHPSQVTDIRGDTSTVGSFFDLQKAALQGGKISDNPLYTGALGEYNNVIIHSSAFIPNGVVSGNASQNTHVRRAVFCGAQAAAVGYGLIGGVGKYDWKEQELDYTRTHGVMAHTICGIKKMVFNSVDYGTIVISSYSAAH